jgi:hypothetical protein
MENEGNFLLGVALSEQNAAGVTPSSLPLQKEEFLSISLLQV